MRKALFLVLLLSMLSSYARAITPEEVTAPGAEPVEDSTAIKALLDNLTIYGRYTDGTDWIEYHAPNGRSAYWEKGCTSPGVWWIQEKQICYAYPNYRDGAPNCFLLFRTAGGVQFVSTDGEGNVQLSSTSTKIIQGNPENLSLDKSVQCLGV